MAIEKERIEDLMSQLPEELQNEVLRFVESLVGRNKRGDGVQSLRQGGDVLSKGAESSVMIKSASSVRSFFGAWESGDPRSSDNERIDADLAQSYTNPHETR